MTLHKPRMNLPFKRCFCASRTSSQDPALLADALGLLSPKRNVKNTANYKPLILRNLQKGSILEQYAEIKKELMADFKIPTTDHAKQVNVLLLDLHLASEPHKSVLQKHLLNHVRTLQSEEELLELVKLLFYQNRLSLAVLTRFMLNRHLRLLQRLPFDVENLDKVAFTRNGWTERNFGEFRILLLKKYHDLNKPLLIITSLKENFAGFLHLIETHQLTPFYERIVWKFYFEYIQQLHPQYNEAYYIEKLNNVRSSFLMWESSLQNNRAIVAAALKQHSLSPLQKIFLTLCASDSVQLIISQELVGGKSPLLSALKKLSVKFKIYAVGDTSVSSVATRALGYSLIHLMESTIKDNFANWTHDAVLVELLRELNQQRTEMIQHDPEPHEVGDGVLT